MFGLTPYRKSNLNLRRVDPFNNGSIFDDFFNDSLIPGFFMAENPIKTDIRETEKEYIVEAELPGVTKEDIKIDLRDDVLSIFVEQNKEVNEERENYIRRERKYGSYCRNFYVDNVDNEKVTARYDNGVLFVTLPKAKETKDKKSRIDIQ